MFRSRPLGGFVFCVTIAALAACGDDEPKTTFATPEEAAADPDFVVQGEYAGEKAGLQVVALGKGQFRTVLYRGGLPGADWDGSEPEVVDGENKAAVEDLIEDLSLERVERTSPTLGKEPPEGAVVLFDGTRETFEAHWRDGARITDDGLLMEGANSIDTFQDFSIHLEFRLPFMPLARGQARGNSGLYYQSRYETQMLDSFGLEGKHNETGGIYEIRDPDLNMCLPPLTWQTYDADFTAARFDENGEKTANARLTVRLNGVVIHNDVEVPRPTRASPIGDETPAPGPIHLQNHGNPVRYRNIWVVPRDADQEARRPIIPAFERFNTSRASDPTAHGRLLLGELNCTACHPAEGEFAQRLLPKQAPILTNVGDRLQADWVWRYLSDPHSVKPGTTMPDLLGSLSDQGRAAAAQAITSFLVSNQRPAEQRPDRQLARQGEILFHEIGCVACHQPRNGTNVPRATTVPLPELAEKYSIPSLAAFVENPHAVRPSGRMPGFHLNNQEAQHLAHYLLGDLVLTPREPNMRFTAFHGSWQKVPDFDELEPVASGECAALDLTVAGRTNDFGVRFEGFLRIDQPGEYTFHLGSDDGSLLYIDGEKTVDTDGIHPHTVHTGKATLTAGMHPIQVDYQQLGGEWTLGLEYEGPGVPRQDAFAMIAMTDDPQAVPAARIDEPPDEVDPTRFIFDEALVAKGRELFSSIGCANCHQLVEGGQRIASTLMAPTMLALNSDHGCLAATRSTTDVNPAAAPGSAVPNFDLNREQTSAIVTALNSAQTAGAFDECSGIADSMAAYNCYACHARGGLGGPETARNALFLTTIPEMGDEGRIPPPLDGVGDKLNDNWLRHILQNGANDRPYMLTRMPRFAPAHSDQLLAEFVAVDRPPEGEFAAPDEPEHRVKATGRHLAGDQALGCIKCHTFGPHRATGIQSMDLQKMTQRLREDWFHRYLPDPQRYRPGTRMPTGFPNGKATITDVYDGSLDHQVSAIWSYLTDGNRAGIPDGLVGQLVELKPATEPIIYRNFLEGLSPRGIAVGYPEGCHLAWDADRMCLAIIWHGRFIDASMHWQGRGQGRQRPLGDHIIALENTAPFAMLDSVDTPWPAETVKERGYRFRGYTLNDRKQPAFRYETDRFTVTDFSRPVAHDNGDGTFARTLTVEGTDNSVGSVYFRAATGTTIEPIEDNWYLVENAVRVRVDQDGAFVRESEGRRELLVPVDLTIGVAKIVQEIVW